MDKSWLVLRLLLSRPAPFQRQWLWLPLSCLHPYPPSRTRQHPRYSHGCRWRFTTSLAAALPTSKSASTQFGTETKAALGVGIVFGVAIIAKLAAIIVIQQRRL
ncbi:hypothetical protein L207DRAFT_33191 [Hyaloscypha variabilis F]|uniref:Uncharacterized protein n=1 Tax=Hyaloscypha variabilis (strain UAMH 11265 / GT02V1 / F) TaxID=1149755 RepID=A0A2J6RN57_HYAVF|nr:hypothetical protein L207DRAFT_33191 [Hyaloscypha variabilis F]